MIKQQIPELTQSKAFDSLGLSTELLRAITERGYTKPTPIQQKAIPVIFEGKDILAAAQTGTGKTAGFALPILQMLSQRRAVRGKNSVRALILAPTRELAAQVEESVATYGRHLPLIKSTAVFGGVGINPQIESLRRGIDILVATPGRLLDHVQQRTLDLSRVEILVLDEADRMLDMGFIRDIRRILSLLPSRRQSLLFSATFNDEIRQLADDMLDAPVLIEVAPRNTAAETVGQLVHPVDRGRKRALLSHLIRSNDWRQVLVFTRTKHGANRLSKQLMQDGISAAAIHGNKSQGARTRSLADFKQGDVRVLVATDIASRGLDIDRLPHVVNFELPTVSEDYIHRIGRTGRADRQGTAISLVCVDERDLLKDIERLLRIAIPQTVIEGYEPDPSIRAEPIFKGRNDGTPRRDGARQPRKISDGPRTPERTPARRTADSKAGARSAHAQDRAGTPREPSGRQQAKSRINLW